MVDLTHLTALDLSPLPQPNSNSSSQQYEEEVTLEDSIEETFESSDNLQAFNRDEMFELARYDLDVLGGLALEEELTLLFPLIFTSIWQLLTTAAMKARDFSKLAIGLPRGFGKTTVVKLFIFWLVLYSNKRYILITAANSTKAERILKDVKRLFQSPNIRAIFGNVLSDTETDTQELLIFRYNGRLIALQALGSGGDPRGSNIGFARPDVIVSDDIQGKENAESPTKSKALREWYNSTLKYAKSEKGCLYIYIGNMYATDICLLREFRDSPDWTSFIAGAILSDGRSIWEEFRSTEEILQDLAEAIRSKTTHIFFSEILNDSTASGNIIFDPSLVKTITKGTEVGLNQGSFIVIDPAGRKKTSNDTAIGLNVLIDGIPYLKELERGIYTPKDTIIRAINLAKMNNCGVICVEDYAYQDTLLYWFEFVAKIYDIQGLEFLPINRGSTSKNGAILSMVTQLQEGEIGIYSHLMGECLTDIIKFNPQTTNNKDDLLDLLVYAPKVVLRYRSNIGRLINSSYMEDNIIGVLPVDQNCNF